MYTIIRQSFEWSLKAISVALLVTLAAIVIIAVVCRFMGSSLIWYDEVASVLLAWLTYYGGALAALKRSHLAFSGLFLKLPQRPRKMVFFLSEFTIILFFIAIAWAGFHVMVIFGEETLISLPFIPLKVTQSVIPIGALLFIMAELISLPDAYKQSMAEFSPKTVRTEDKGLSL